MLISVGEELLRRIERSDNSTIYLKFTKCSSTPLEIKDTCIYFPYQECSTVRRLFDLVKLLLRAINNYLIKSALLAH